MNELQNLIERSVILRLASRFRQPDLGALAVVENVRGLMHDEIEKGFFSAKYAIDT